MPRIRCDTGEAFLSKLEDARDAAYDGRLF